jgi:hypothetical protein
VQYGLIAEQVAHQFPTLVQRAPDGKPTGVYYQELPVLLLAQLQRQQRRIQAQGRQLAHQQQQIDWLLQHTNHH